MVATTLPLVAKLVRRSDIAHATVRLAWRLALQHEREAITDNNPQLEQLWEGTAFPLEEQVAR